MEKFFSLPAEKQNSIIDASLRCFSANGYKKTSVSDISSAAGISKAMVFHYFGTKKALYLYLIDYCSGLVMKEMEERLDLTVNDFFERIRLSASIKTAVMKKHPAILAFLTNAYFETDDEVRDDLMALFEQGEGFRTQILSSGLDDSKFKENCDIKLLMKMLYWMAEGYASQLSIKIQILKPEEIDLDEIFGDFYACLDMLRRNFYKEEYL